MSSLVNIALVASTLVSIAYFFAWRNEVRKRKAREATLRNPGSKQMVFVRESDGRVVHVEGCACRTCKNFFWITQGEFEAASFCPYCGVKFTRVYQISAEEMRSIQVL